MTMTSTATATSSETGVEAPEGRRVVVELFTAEPTGCAPCQTALDEIDTAASLLSDELGARGDTRQVRVLTSPDTAAARAHTVTTVPSVRVNGVEIRPEGSQDCDAPAGMCPTYEWQGTTYPAPPAELLTTIIQGRLDQMDARPATPATLLSAADVDELRTTVRGAVHSPGEQGWDESRAIYNLAFDLHPALVVVPADAADAATVVQFATDHGLRIAPQRTGHNAGPLGEDLSDVILLRTDAMTDVRIDAHRRLATVGAGAKWEHVVPVASELGLAAPHGSTADVSVTGYALGGGVGWYGRRYGLATNNVSRIQLLTPDGRLRWVDHNHERDLFWALRGGGGNFGIVTAVQIRLFPVRELYAGHLFYPLEKSAEVLKAWRSWTETVPETVTSVGRIMQIPDEEGVPAPLRGGSFAVVEAFILGTRAEGEELMATFRAMNPVLDTFEMRPPADIAELHMDPPEPLPYDADHLVLRDVTPEAIDDLVEAIGAGTGSQLAGVEIRHLGGAFSRAEPTHGALARMAGEYLIFGVGEVPTPEDAKAVRHWLETMKRPVEHLASGHYYNFSEHPVDPSILYPADVYARLQEIRRRVDPGGLIRANHAIAVPPGPGDR